MMNVPFYNYNQAIIFCQFNIMTAKHRLDLWVYSTICYQTPTSSFAHCVPLVLMTTNKFSMPVPLDVCVPF